MQSLSCLLCVGPAGSTGSVVSCLLYNPARLTTEQRHTGYLFKGLKPPVAALVCGFVPPPQTHQQSARDILGLHNKVLIR